MPKDSTSTRDSILDAAQEQILEKGYGGTSVDAILSQTGVTKGAFFHHFPTKQDLAYAIIERYAAADRAMLDEFVERASEIASDPLHRLLIVIGLYQDSMGVRNDPTKGCIFAAYGYQSGVFGERTSEVVTDSFAYWLDVIGGMFQEAIDAHPPRKDVSAQDLAMTALTIFQGGLSLSKNFNNPDLLAVQLRHFRSQLELLFGAA